VNQLRVVAQCSAIHAAAATRPQQEITHAPTTPEIDDQYIEVGSMLNIAST